jgi:hypothetical protein
MTTTISDVAARVIQAAGQSGGIDEVRRIAARGWIGDVEIDLLPAKDYEDFDDCLAAAVADVAREMGLETWELSAEWETYGERHSIVIRSSSQTLKTAIQERARWTSWLASHEEVAS